MATELDEDHARVVLTLGGDVKSLRSACLSLAEWALGEFDLTRHHGAHPRFGVVDVLPLIPYGADEESARALAVELAEQIEKDFGVPVHTYGRAHPEERSLPELRRYLRTTPHPVHPTAGVVCLGIRDPLVAFNVNFRGPLGAAKRVARDVRAPEIRALGFPLASRGIVQVSMNLIAPDVVGPRKAFDRVVALARAHPLELVECEVVGLVPHPILPQLEGLPLMRPVHSIEQALAEKGLA